jgi:hypothetical protein
MTRYHQRPYKPLPAGKVLARCTICRVEAVAQGDGRPVTMRHAEDCPERAPSETDPQA